ADVCGDHGHAQAQKFEVGNPRQFGAGEHASKVDVSHDRDEPIYINPLVDQAKVGDAILPRNIGWTSADNVELGIVPGGSQQLHRFGNCWQTLTLGIEANVSDDQRFSI